jgi:hypothetical protein
MNHSRIGLIRKGFIVVTISLLLVAPLVEPASAATGVEPLPLGLSTYWNRKILRWESLIVEAAQNRKLDPDFLASLVWMESRGDPYAVGPVGAIGLMQVMPREAGFEWRPTGDVLMDPAINLFWGSRTLATVISQGHGDVFNSLAAYNGGWDQVMYRGPTIFATSILRDYAHAVAVRHGIEGDFVAFFARKDVSIKGPIWIADSNRKDVYFFGSENRLPDGMPLIPDVSPSSVIAYSLDTKTSEAFVTGLWLYAVDEATWIQVPSPEISEFLRESAVTAAASPELVAIPASQPVTSNRLPAPVPAPQAESEPVMTCEGGDFWAEGWQLHTVVNTVGWTATIYAEGHGGDCQYTYAWNVSDEIKGQNMWGPVTFDIYMPNRDGTIVGTVLASSGDSVAKIGIYIPAPPK